MSETPVLVSLSDLSTGACDHLLPDAFGTESLGIIIVKDLPANFLDLRRKVLSSASRLAALPQTTLEKLEDPESHWLNGWSLGKEKLSNGAPDNLKGSYYANCSFYAYQDLPPVIPKGYESHGGFTSPQLWPEETDLPMFKKDLTELCNLMIGVAAQVAEAIDRLFGGKLDGYPEGYMKHIVSTSTTTKARLLHYFPPSQEQADRDRNDGWCGEHFDFSCLTALTSAMFIDETDPRNNNVDQANDNDKDEDGKGKGKLLYELETSPDPESGLYIKSRLGKVVKVSIPRDCLAFQTGSALQEATSNKFKAVSHYVKGSNVANICRNTLAVFCQPSLHEPVGPNFKDFASYSKHILASTH